MRGAERVLDPLGTVGPSEKEAEVSVALRQITCRPGPMVSSQRSAEEGSDRRRSPLGSATRAPQLARIACLADSKTARARRPCKRHSLSNDFAGTTATRRT
jgi:hypothetical protein